MTDREFIIFICGQLWELISDGDEPDMDTIENELKSRGINSEDIFTY